MIWFNFGFVLVIVWFLFLAKLIMVSRKKTAQTNNILLLSLKKY